MTAARIPAAEWQAADSKRTPESMAKIARWLGIDIDQHGSFYGLLPFRRMETDDGPAVAAALAPPLVFFDWPKVMAYKCVKREDGSFGRDAGILIPSELPDHIFERIGRCAEDSDVLLCDRNQLHRIRDSHLILPSNTDDPVQLFTCSKAFARAWAANRMMFLERRRIAKETYFMEIQEPLDGGMPGALLIGKPEKVQWPASVNFTAPDEATAKIINIAIWKAARLSRVAVSPQSRAFA